MVLGAIDRITGYNGDVDDLKQTGKYQVVSTAKNAAFTIGHILVVIRCIDYVAQIAIDVDGVQMSYRSIVDRAGRSFSSWRFIA